MCPHVSPSSFVASLRWSFEPMTFEPMTCEPLPSVRHRLSRRIFSLSIRDAKISSLRIFALSFFCRLIFFSSLISFRRIFCQRFFDAWSLSGPTCAKRIYAWSTSSQHSVSFPPFARIFSAHPFLPPLEISPLIKDYFPATTRSPRIVASLSRKRDASAASESAIAASALSSSPAGA